MYLSVVKGQQQQSRKEVIAELLEKIETRLKTGEVKATLGDYIRLLQLHKEMEADEPRDIEVRWVDSKTDPSP